jgi:hypothetical protein
MRALLIILIALAAAPAFADTTIVPDPLLTPWAVRTTDTTEICSHGTRQLRHCYRARDDRMAEYGLPPGPHPQHEIDHSIPLCLGGADSDRNLWPQPRRSIEPVWATIARTNSRPGCVHWCAPASLMWSRRRSRSLKTGRKHIGGSSANPTGKLRRRSRDEGPPLRRHPAAARGRLYPTLPKIELFARGKARPGWDAWGNEAEPQPARDSHRRHQGPGSNASVAGTVRHWVRRSRAKNLFEEDRMMLGGEAV